MCIRDRGSGARYETGIDHNIVNVPLSRGAGSDKFRNAMTFEILPALKKFNPSILIVSAGFDAHRKDPLGGLGFTDDDFYWAVSYTHLDVYKRQALNMVCDRQDVYRHYRETVLRYRQSVRSRGYRIPCGGFALY